jgi:hypothetical protein
MDLTDRKENLPVKNKGSMNHDCLVVLIGKNTGSILRTINKLETFEHESCREMFSL